MLVECIPYLLIRERPFLSTMSAYIIFIQLFLCEPHEMYDVQELGILPVNYVELLIEIMLVGVF